MKWLQERAKNQPNQPFLNGFTFAEVFEMVETKAYQYALLPDKKVAFAPENTVEDAITLMALLALGKEILLLNPKMKSDEMTKAMKKLHIFTLITDKSKPIIFRGNLSLNWNPEPEKIAVMMNTSATTGEFKTVPITWKMIEAQVSASAQVLSVQDNDNWLAVLPIFHVSGLSILMRSLFNGTQITLMKKFNPETILSNNCNMISLVPTMLKRILSDLTADKFRVILLGGESIPLPLMMDSLSKKLPIYKTYGATETFSQSVTFNILDAPDKLEAVGKALPNVKISIAENGEILVKSPMTMSGYLGKEPLSGQFLTGDIGEIDADGFLYVTGRTSDMIISGGENIYPREIENVAYGLSNLTECAVIGKFDEKWGQIPVIYYAGKASETELQEHLIKHLTAFKIPKKFVKLDTLPKNASNKIDKKVLKTYEN